MGGVRGSVLLALVACALVPSAASAYDARREQANFSRVEQRYAYEQSDPAYQAEATGDGLRGTVDILERDIREGNRFSGSLCGSGMLACAGDPRVYDYAGRLGLQLPVLYVNRNGAHIEGHVWVSLRSLQRVEQSNKPRVKRRKVCRRVPRHGAHRHPTKDPRLRKAHRLVCRTKKVKLPPKPLRLPGVVLETGSIQAPERWYYWAAQVLAAHDYAVMTFDVQGQGRSDATGTGNTTFEGFPAQDLGHFVEDLADAIDFFHSSAATPYVPRGEPAKVRQAEQVAAGKATAHNPLHGVLDSARLGIVGHSLGASAVTVLQAEDPRVDAIVAWDNLGSGTQPRVPALGMSADYGLVPYPYASDPDPDSKNDGFRRWREAGVDAMQVNLRGGTHFEWSYSPGPILGASLRGIDAAAWYTTAWFDRYVKGDATADRRLLTTRFTADPIDAQIQPEEQGNLFSFYLRSPVSFRAADGERVECHDLRGGSCPRQGADDGGPPGAYSWRADRG